jgi:hypothetical protein
MPPPRANATGPEKATIRAAQIANEFFMLDSLNLAITRNLQTAFCI